MATKLRFPVPSSFTLSPHYARLHPAPVIVARAVERAPSIEPIDPEDADDIAAIRAALGADADSFTDLHLRDAWAARSENWDAGWLSLPSADELAKEVRPYLPKL